MAERTTPGDRRGRLLKPKPDRQKTTPPELARRWGITPEKMIGWIRTGELRAINAATNGRAGRPRWLIDLADIAAFEQRRAAVPSEPKQQAPRRYRPAGHVIQFF